MTTTSNSNQSNQRENELLDLVARQTRNIKLAVLSNLQLALDLVKRSKAEAAAGNERISRHLWNEAERHYAKAKSLQV
jgi:hypothetical protein